MCMAAAFTAMALRDTGSQPVDGTPDAQGSSIDDMCVDHRRAHVCVPEQFLHCTDGVSVITLAELEYEDWT